MELKLAVGIAAVCIMNLVVGAIFASKYLETSFTYRTQYRDSYGNIGSFVSFPHLAQKLVKHRFSGLISFTVLSGRDARIEVTQTSVFGMETYFGPYSLVRYLTCARSVVSSETMYRC